MAFGHCCPDTGRYLLSNSYRYITESQYKSEFCFPEQKPVCRNAVDGALIHKYSQISLLCS